MTITPLLPAEPAFAVSMLIAPVVDAAPTPLLTLTKPPVATALSPAATLTEPPAPSSSLSPIATEASFLEKQRENNRVAAKRARVRKKALNEWLQSRTQQLDEEKAFIIATLSSVQDETQHQQTLHQICTRIESKETPLVEQPAAEATDSQTSPPSTPTPDTTTVNGPLRYRDHHRAMNRQHAYQSRKRKKISDGLLQQKVEEQQVELAVYRETLETVFGKTYACALLSKNFPAPEAVSVQMAIKSNAVLPIEFPTMEEALLAKRHKSNTNERFWQGGTKGGTDVLVMNESIDGTVGSSSPMVESSHMVGSQLVAPQSLNGSISHWLPPTIHARAANRSSGAPVVGGGVHQWWEGVHLGVGAATAPPPPAAPAPTPGTLRQ
jgi:hypothetical protein